MRSIKHAALAAAALALSFAAAIPAKAQDIVDVAAGNGSFNTLVAAVKAAGLVDTLKGKGPFTVFAPTDEAFAKLPKGTVDDLLKPANKAKLQSILTYHVVAGKYDAKRITGAKSKTYGVKSVQGGLIPIDIRKGVKAGPATVVKADVAASNGVIHVIDTVLLPPTKRAKH
ncbi:MAG: fasciclin domain-containing protein [Hyphomicrobiaceae bacterium]